MSHLRANLCLVGLTLLVCCVLYPVMLLSAGQLAFHDQANGSFVTVDGKPVGSRLIAQAFTANHYFWPRPSAASYNAAASGASNWAANNPKLRFRVARQLGPIVKYVDGRPVGPDVEKWFAEKDRVAAWAADKPTLAAEWVKTDDNTKQLVKDWTNSHTDVLDQWRKDNVRADDPNLDDSPDAVAVQFFASFAAKHPRTLPAMTDKRLTPVATGPDVQGVFFDVWLQEHRDAALQQVPADMVMASGSGLDPHITLRNARYQLDRVAAARGGPAAEIDKLLGELAHAPLAGLAGEPLVNVLEVNLELDKRFPKPAGR